MPILFPNQCKFNWQSTKWLKTNILKTDLSVQSTLRSHIENFHNIWNNQYGQESKNQHFIICLKEILRFII